MSILFIEKVNAQGIFFTNKNEVEFTKKEYDAISEFYWEGYQNDLSIEELQYLRENGVFDSLINTIKINDKTNNHMELLVEHTTANKNLKMSSVCTTHCIVSVVLTWINLPTVRSYDIIGEYLDGTSIINSNKVIIYTDIGNTSYTISKIENNGIGTSIKLPTGINSLKVAHTLIVERSGTINASYQHAKKSISLEKSKKYAFSKTGVGGVFKFSNGIKDYYDCMQGVSLTLK